MEKQIWYRDDARNELEKGIKILAEAVSITLGPKGRNVVLSRHNRSPQIVNDGVTIAKEIELENHIENTGAALIRQAASKTNDIAGDGTTTATVLSYAMIKQGIRSLSSGSNPIELKKGIEKATNYIIKEIIDIAKTVDNIEEIRHIAQISGGNDQEIGKIIALAIEKIGREGIISVEEGKSIITELEIVEGMKLDKGFISPYFITDTQKMEIIQNNPLILLTDKKISLVQQELIPILEKITKSGRPLTIIAEDIEKEVLATMIVNKLKGKINIVAVKAPGFGDRRKAILEDIAILTNGQIISEDLGLDFRKIELNILGQARKIIVTKDSTTIIAKNNEKTIQNRCDQLRKQIELSDSDYIKETLQQRLAKLTGAIAIIKVGAATEIEMKDKKLRLEDAINATKAAIEEGIVAGGGSTLAHLYNNLNEWSKNNLGNDELIGAQIVKESLLAPIKKIADNCGFNGSVIAEQVKNSDICIGYNAYNNKISNMYEAGIIDPAKVTRSAIQNASSIVSMFLTTECIISNTNNKFTN
uniref:chaperonin GroEL n=1 Tax=Pulvinaster venetus TaxID=427767 RepID=UPI001FCDEC69|nr:chaperonin GroEL [Pulvinaster venetus]UNJ16918.1 chaperonin GroEL [Pulvinaster venetus]